MSMHHACDAGACESSKHLVTNQQLRVCTHIVSTKALRPVQLHVMFLQVLLVVDVCYAGTMHAR